MLLIHSFILIGNIISSLKMVKGREGKGGIKRASCLVNRKFPYFSQGYYKLIVYVI